MSHHDCEGYSSGSVLLAFVLGGMVGAGVALLLAPQSGTETRRRIRELADDVKDRATDYAGTAKDKVVTTVDKAKELYEEKKSAISAAVEAGKDAYEKEVGKE
ncbi:MAG TPA: YtxH domain-containing protein [Dissulfurispiraceae bacterium]|nr:YtxH domain-containing protein [Dissulfurispiraceae bacterium]